MAGFYPQWLYWRRFPDRPPWGAGFETEDSAQRQGDRVGAAAWLNARGGVRHPALSPRTDRGRTDGGRVHGAQTRRFRVAGFRGARVRPGRVAAARLGLSGAVARRPVFQPEPRGGPSTHRGVAGADTHR